ncbi:hypothetical protein C8J56DRAFT_196072 [Mycena floridula]|nr:hypothetical protein C8J56DRAFT_196072 [Mycena floridula]
MMLFRPPQRLAALAAFVAILLISTFVLFRSSFHEPAAEYYHYYLAGRRTCPSVHDIGRPLLDHSDQKCTSLPSRLDQFEAQICIAPRTCNQFTLRIRRVDQAECLAAESLADPSFLPDLSHWMRTQRGPDSFYVRTDGAERYATVYGTYEGSCSYTYDLRLKNPGEILLQTWWTQGRYEGFSETNTSWPEMHLQPVFDPIFLKTCSPECSANSAVVKPFNRRVTTIPETQSATLPACNSSDSVPGSFIPLHHLDRFYPQHQNPEPVGVPVVGRYGFVPESCEWKHAGLRFGDHSACTKKKRKIFLVGDSHGRVIFDSMAHRLSGHSDLLMESEKVGDKFATVGNLDIQFLWDPRGHEFVHNHDEACRKLGNADVVVTSLGSHWANSNMTDYLKEIPMIMKALMKCPFIPTADAPKRSYIFVTLPAGPQRQDEWARGFKDHRTNVRSAYQTEVGIRMAHELPGWSTVDQFALTIPFSMESLYVDMAHYLVNDALDPILDEVIGKSGVCG